MKPHRKCLEFQNPSNFESSDGRNNTYFPCVSLTSTSYLDPPLWTALIGSFQFAVKSPTKNTSSPCIKVKNLKIKKTNQTYKKHQKSLYFCN